MSKPVRLRRGSTASHATFTGADGEVTFDTDKKCLVLHDGATPGGHPVGGFLVLAPPDPSSYQEVASIVILSGGSPGEVGLDVYHDAVVRGRLAAGDTFSAGRFEHDFLTLTYAATVNLDFTLKSSKLLTLAGNLSLTGTNMVSRRTASLWITGDGSLRTLAFPAGWKFIGGAAPTNIAANKTALLELTCFGLLTTDVVARYAVQS